ncbi:hypothetical protein BDY21DRAFT_385436 [Lineolata rhizophorae]|uniref:Secreted protein n=1 Tax=Lineolata rhizophorae TaxID=578093 RepID=A0A6A6P3S1_9PEZI|nr:hypothetical protein BDY21DRAFT_385436 [Lineolata rhizophorae]
MKLSAALAIFPALIAASPAALDTQTFTPPDPSTVQIMDVAYGGSGCPQGTVGTAISEDRTTMTLIFDEYVASLSPQTPVTENRKNCQINVELQYPGGFQYSVFSADYRGYAAVDQGVTGTIRSTYYFSGQTAQCSTEAVFEGPMDGDYLKHDEADNASIVWSPCGESGMLNINSQVRLTTSDRSKSGLLTTDSLDAKFTQEIYVQWRECSE